MSDRTTQRSPKRSSPRSGPSEIAPGVFVGGWDDAVRFEGTRFCVLDEKPEGMPKATHIPVYDEPSGSARRENLDRLAREVTSARGRGEPVLIFCGHGVRRSPLGGAWYLHRSEGLTLEQAYARIRAARPKVEPASAWVPDPSTLAGP
jgi:protein-tyrosine phosphatase